MFHADDLTGLAVVALAALVCGVAMARLRQPPVVGYILAGLLLGPAILGLVTSREQIELLAELGVLLLLFLIGMEFDLRALRPILARAALATVLQVVGALLVTGLISGLFGWSLAQSLLFGFVIALSSTAVAIKMLEDIGEVESGTGRLIVGVLIAQDLAFVPMMLVVANLSGGGFDAVGILQLALAIALLAAVIFILSGRSFSLPFGRFIAGHADLLPLMSLAFCFGAAALAGIAGLTPAYGAFLAGLVIGASREREATIERTRPIQSILMMVFFVSIGLLINPALIWDNLGLVVTLLLLIILFKTAFNVLIMRALGEPWPSAFLSGLVLAQIGEFSFLLAAAGVGAGLITGEDGDLVVAVAALSLLFGPAWLAVARRLHLPALQSVRSSLEMFRLLYESNTLNSRVITDMTRRAVRRGKTRRSTRRSRRGPRPDA